MKNQKDTRTTGNQTKKTLRLARETLRVLGADELGAVAGGRSWGCCMSAHRD